MGILRFLKDKISLNKANNPKENTEEVKNSVSNKFNELSKKIHEIVKPLGYKKDDLNFRLYQDDGLCKIINLQKNRYNTKQCLEFTINIGIYFEKDDVIKNVKFKEYECAIRNRVHDDNEWWKITENTNIDEVFESVKRALEKAFVVFKEFNSKQKTIQLILNNKAQEYSDTNVMNYNTAKLLVDMGYSNEVYELIKDTDSKHQLLFDLANQIKKNLIFDDNNTFGNLIVKINNQEIPYKLSAERFTLGQKEKIQIEIRKLKIETENLKIKDKIDIIFDSNNNFKFYGSDENTCMIYAKKQNSLCAFVGYDTDYSFDTSKFYNGENYCYAIKNYDEQGFHYEIVKNPLEHLNWDKGHIMEVRFAILPVNSDEDMEQKLLDFFIGHA